ncbi:MAG: penicillin-binding protein [Candidatus Nomurabacteria bacterium]|nr:penicillin-binding protein [Candidatus Nomurabacteria bacterium]
MNKVKKHLLKNWVLGIIGFCFLVGGVGIIWISTLQLPDFKLFTERKIASSTKIYDRTGKIVLYDVHKDIKRTVIRSEEIGVNVKNATVAIEDSSFYNHKGIRITSIIRAAWSTITGQKVEGGSTITQQLIKETLLTSDRTVTRKIKEWILAIKLERVMGKDDILTLYLNEAPYGGNIYGIEEASKAFFGVEPLDLTLAQSAYLAAIPNGPTYYSPYGKNKSKLDGRKNLVLTRMHTLKFITDDEYKKAIEEKVEFLPTQPLHIAAPHFVFYIKDYIEKKYGTEAIENGGLKVITTLDFDLEQKTEQIALAHALDNEKNWNGKNAAVVIIDPKTGQILSMVGSRNYFDKSIDGNFNVATAERQPGSSFKPIVYATAFKKGYTEDTTLFDVPTEFSTNCDTYSHPLGNHKKTDCYNPDNFDNGFRGPMTLKNALAQSINVIAVKLLYLVGVPDVLKMAHDLGVTTLNDPSRYGLSLVIGGGETTLLDMTSVYSVFAAEGVRHQNTGILSVEDSSGVILEQYKDNPEQILDSNIPRMLADILTDNVARTPTYGANSALVLPDGIQAAVKTGTTNDNKDAWTVGYTPSVVVGVWVGNNDNKPMGKGGVALAGPIWHDVIIQALTNLPHDEVFNKPDPIDPNLPPVVRGYWQGNKTFKIDKASGGLATEYTPATSIEEKSITDVHTILYWINRNDPTTSKNPGASTDSLYNHFETGIRDWWYKNSYKYKNVNEGDQPKYSDNTHNSLTKPSFTVVGLSNNAYKNGEDVSFTVNALSQSPVQKIDIFVNNTYITSLKSAPYNVSFTPSELGIQSKSNSLLVKIYDVDGGSSQQKINFNIE